MTSRRRLVWWTAGVTALVLVALALVPLLFRGRLESALKDQISTTIDGQVDWGGVRVGLFRDFPHLTLRVDELLVTGAGRFEGDTLLTVADARLVLDLRSVVRSMRAGEPVVVRTFELHRPDLRLVVLEDGIANWELIAAPADRTPTDGDRAFQLDLRSFTIHDGALAMTDRQADVQASVTGLRQSLRGDFGGARFTLQTRTAADAVSLRFAGVPYLSEAELDVRADLEVDGATGRIEVRDNRVRLNDLLLDLAGSVVTGGETIRLDLAFSAPGTDFREVLSMVPAVYAREFETIRTSGTMAVSGWVRGEYGPDAFPALALEATVRDGSFRYPDLPLPARDIALDLSVTNPGGHLDHTVLDLTRFHLVLGDDPIHGSLRLSSPISDPDIGARLEGRLDLADLGRTVRLEGVDELQGIVLIDASVRARMSELEAQQHDRIGAEGVFTVTDLALRAVDLPHPLLIDEARLSLTPRHADLTAFRGRLGTSDLAMTGRLDNLLGFVLRDEDLRGQATVTSSYLALDEWRSDDEVQAVLVPANIDFVLDAAIDRITFADLDMRDARGRLGVRDQRLSLEDFRLALLGGAMTLTGYYETLDPALPAFDMDLRLVDIDIPAAFAGLGTVQAFAPVARYAVGQVSGELRLNGTLGPDMLPMHDVLNGLGAITTEGVRLQDFPPLDRLASTLQLPLLQDPGLVDFRSTLVIRDGRLHVSPFDVRIGDVVMNVAGSNGLDQSMDYTLGMEVPRIALGSGADAVLTSLIARAGRAGLELQPTDVISLGARLTGTVTSPAVTADFRGVAEPTGRAVQQALRDEADRRVEAMEAQLHAAAEEAAARVRAEAARALAEAERRAGTIREEARGLAAVIRREGDEQADALLARATTPAARLAARPAADRLRREAAGRADAVVREADVRAEALLAEARRRAGQVQDP